MFTTDRCEEHGTKCSCRNCTADLSRPRGEVCIQGVAAGCDGAALPVVKQLKVHSMRAMEALAPRVPTL